MTLDIIDPTLVDQPPDWVRDRKLMRRGFKYLAYLPKGRRAWNCTLAAWAFSARRRLVGPPDFNLWAAMHALTPSKRHEELGDDALVLWHGTSAPRARKIVEHGLIHKEGVWAAVDPKIAHSFTRGRSSQYQTASAMVVLVVSKDEWDSKAEAETDHIVRFHTSVPPECVEYIIYDDHIDFVGGAKARKPKRWGVARFKKRGKTWTPRARPPVRLDREQMYRTPSEWLELSIRRILTTLGEATAVEVFSSLYATVDPWDALEHKEVFAALEELCEAPRMTRGGLLRFRLKELQGENA